MLLGVHFHGAGMTELSASFDVISPHLNGVIPPERCRLFAAHTPFNFRKRGENTDEEHNQRVMAHIRDPFCTFWHKYTINRIKVKYGKKRSPVVVRLPCD
jgi:hypothetical protein